MPVKPVAQLEEVMFTVTRWLYPLNRLDFDWAPPAVEGLHVALFRWVHSDLCIRPALTFNRLCRLATVGAGLARMRRYAVLDGRALLVPGEGSRSRLLSSASPSVLLTAYWRVRGFVSRPTGSPSENCGAGIVSSKVRFTKFKYGFTPWGARPVHSILAIVTRLKRLTLSIFARYRSAARLECHGEGVAHACRLKIFVIQSI